MANIQCEQCRARRRACDLGDVGWPCSTCKGRFECQSPYESALAKLDEANRSWIDNAIPDRLAAAFATANRLFCIADFHRLLRPEDAPLFKTKKPTFQMAFVTGEDMDRTNSILGEAAPPLIGCHDLPGRWVEKGNAKYRDGLSTTPQCTKQWTQNGFKAGDPNCIVLLSLEGLNTALIELVKNMGGFVIFVEDANNPLIDPGNFHLRITSAILPDILGALTELRSVYRKPRSKPTSSSSTNP